MTDGATVEDEATVEDRAPFEERRPRRRRRRGKGIAVAFVVVAVAAAAATATLGLGLGGGGSADGRKASELPPNTAEVTRQTLKDTQTADGKLGYGLATTATSRLPGTLTTLPDSGGTITRGRALYEVDDEPVMLMYGSKPAYRALKPGIEGADVRQLERNLKALGYDGFTEDDKYTQDTADAVREWQGDRGLEKTGTVELGRVVFAPSAIRVESLEAGEGDPTAPGRKVLSYTGTDKAVTVELEATDQRLAKKGATVEVTLPDDTTVRGRIEEVSTVIQPGSGQGEAPQTKVEVVVGLKDKKAQKAADPYALASVDVAFTAGTRKDVLTVPVAALLALQEGGFGVEVVKDSTTTYVPVTTGLFAGGKVEISGNGIAEGTTVGMPK